MRLPIHLESNILLHVRHFRGALTILGDSGGFLSVTRLQALTRHFAKFLPHDVAVNADGIRRHADTHRDTAIDG